LGVNRGGVYHCRVGESSFNLSLMRQMDEWYLEDPTLGVLGMVDQFKDHGVVVNPKRTRRLLRKMGLLAIYPKKALSLVRGHHLHPDAKRLHVFDRHHRRIQPQDHGLGAEQLPVQGMLP